ncbi:MULTISPECIES: helix-turn-helix domain-containing protein [Thermomonospora]|uniref:Excisionase family DNA binding protein n=1 Tax=Thermomonospora cellulosilytica TaxID=1411118 RepID=A0A7W3MXY0_9ACTN|nr:MULTISPECIES: helix-turn-helix domain-containing protein [Thermomonospora]MBA9003927.1 excisionase family DNA binding protein [Thermomonospora cellulosilytica]
MPAQPYSVEQVADLLGLHVKTVRGYIRDGRLKAVRIGKQYRIAPEDLAEFTGRPLPQAAPRRRVDVTSIVQVDGIDRAELDRLTTVLTSATAHAHDLGPLRIQVVHDPERAAAKIILLGGPEGTAELLKIVHTLLEGR